MAFWSCSKEAASDESRSRPVRQQPALLPQAGGALPRSVGLCRFASQDRDRAVGAGSASPPDRHACETRRWALHPARRTVDRYRMESRQRHAGRLHPLARARGLALSQLRKRIGPNRLRASSWRPMSNQWNDISRDLPAERRQLALLLSRLRSAEPRFAEASILQPDEVGGWHAAVYLLTGCESVWQVL